jgi:hypothetical protein
LVLVSIGGLVRFCALALVIAFCVVAVFTGGGDPEPVGTSGAEVSSSCGVEGAPVGVV